MFDLTGKGALVTGATGGIGGAIAEALHAQGANVAISGTRAEKLDELAAKLGYRVSRAALRFRDRAAVVKLGRGGREGASARSTSSSTMPASPMTIFSCA